jgi:methyl-accepting chemotaxis protein
MSSGPLRNLPVAQKLFVSFGVLCLLMIGVGTIGLVEVDAANDRLAEVGNDNLRAAGLLGEVRADVQELRVLTASLILHSPAADPGNIEQAVKRKDAEVDEAWSKYRDSGVVGHEAQRSAFDTALTAYRKVRDDELFAAGRAANMDKYLIAQGGQAEPAAQAMTTALNTLANAENADAMNHIALAQQDATRAKIVVGALIGAALLVALVLGLLVSRAMSRPLRRTVEVLEGLAEGRLDERLDVDGKDEVGRMASALNAALDRLTGTLRDVNDNVTTLSSSASELTSVATQMSASAARSAEGSSTVSAASSQIGMNITTVSAGAEEMSSSIGEIARSANSAADVAGKAVRISGEAGQILQKLGTSSAEIVSVIKIITSIAEQTNLLALNATIEAARAGEAGKGFAVVAGEVKELAGETARATEDIRTRVAAIQTDSAAAVAAIAEIGAVIDQINQTQTAIAAAVEEQTATTDEMSRNVSQVAAGSSDISTNKVAVAQAAAETTGAAAHTGRAAQDLSRVASDLRTSLAMFRF